MIKTILFDMGGVVITLAQPQAIERFKALGLKDAEQRLDAYTQQGIFGDLESGKITDEVFRRELSVLVGRELTWQECCEAWKGYCGDVPKRNLRKMKELRERGYRVVLLSNTNPFMMSWVMSNEFDGEGHSLAYYLDAAYESYKCGAMKPDAKFFNAVIKTLHIFTGSFHIIFLRERIFPVHFFHTAENICKYRLMPFLS